MTTENDTLSSLDSYTIIEESSNVASVHVSNFKKRRIRVDSLGSSRLLPEQSRHLKTENQKLKLSSEGIKNIQKKRTNTHYTTILR